MSTTFVALEPDTLRWEALRPRLSKIGMPGIAVDGVRGIESALDALELDAVLIRPLGELEDHRRLVAMLRRKGTRVFVTAETCNPQVLSLYFGLGDQTRTVRPDPAQLVDDIRRHAHQDVDLLPPLPEFGQVMGVANEPPLIRMENTERDPVRPRVRVDRVATGRLELIQLPAVGA